MTTPVPTFSAMGWVSAPADMADALMAHYFEADKKQTALYGSNVSSLPATIQKYAGDIVAMTAAIRNEFAAYIGRYFDTANVDVKFTEALQNGNPTGNYDISLYCLATKDGKDYSFGKLLQVSNSKLSKVISLNNTGSES